MLEYLPFDSLFRDLSSLGRLDSVRLFSFSRSPSDGLLHIVLTLEVSFQ